MKPGQIMHRVWLAIEHEGINESVGVMIVDGDPECEPAQIAATALLGLRDVIFTVRGRFEVEDGLWIENPSFTADDLQGWLA